MMVFITQYIISPSNIRPSLKIFHDYLFIMFRLEETLKYPIIKSVQLMSDFMLCKISKNKSKSNSFTFISQFFFWIINRSISLLMKI